MSYRTVTLLCDDFLQSFYVCVLYVITCCSLLLQVLYWHLYVPITESAGRGDCAETTSSVHVHVQCIYCVSEYSIPTDLDVSIFFVILQIYLCYKSLLLIIFPSTCLRRKPSISVHVYTYIYYAVAMQLPRMATC